MMSSSRGISESTERPSRRFPTPGYGAIFVIIVLALTALLSSCYGADNNPRLSISAPISAEARSNASGDSLLYPVREMRWVTDSALPGLGSPVNVYQVVPFEQGAAAGRDALKRFASHFGSTGEVTNTEGITTIEVTTSDSTNGVPATGVASLYGEVATSVSRPMNTLSYSATPSWAQYSPGSASGGSSTGGSSTGGSSTGGSSTDGSASGTGSSTPPVAIDSEVPITAPPSVPVDLPKNAALLRIAHDVLSAAGIDSSGWQSTINDASAMWSGVSCAPETACDPQESTTILSRQVVMTPLVDSIPVHDLDWYVEVGDKGAVLNASGAWVKTERVGEYSRRGTLNAVAALQAGEGGLGYGWLPMAAAEGKPTGLSSNAVPPSAATSNTLSSNTLSSDLPFEAESSLEPIVVTIKRVEAGYSLQFGAVNGKAAALLVPTYTFFGSSTADGSSTPGLPETESDLSRDPINAEITLNALDPSLFAPLDPEPGDDPISPPDPRPLPPTEPQPTEPQPEPVPAPIPNSSSSPAPADNPK
ncbi:unannotated protein [freshwater metagenome]|uniref:Unannotated protein n=1 Tax=freshwater metagenome TaxID=449393 RepID=A0A6J6VTW3_9ZZZZ